MSHASSDKPPRFCCKSTTTLRAPAALAAAMNLAVVFENVATAASDMENEGILSTAILVASSTSTIYPVMEPPKPRSGCATTGSVGYAVRPNPLLQSVGVLDGDITLVDVCVGVVTDGTLLVSVTISPKMKAPEYVQSAVSVTLGAAVEVAEVIVDVSEGALLVLLASSLEAEGGSATRQLYTSAPLDIPSVQRERSRLPRNCITGVLVPLSKVKLM